MMICHCDGCGKEAPAVFTGKEWLKPAGWFEKPTTFTPNRTADTPRVIQVCSLVCVDKAEETYRKLANIEKT